MMYIHLQKRVMDIYDGVVDEGRNYITPIGCIPISGCSICLLKDKRFLGKKKEEYFDKLNKKNKTRLERIVFRGTHLFSCIYHLLIMNIMADGEKRFSKYFSITEPFYNGDEFIRICDDNTIVWRKVFS